MEGGLGAPTVGDLGVACSSPPRQHPGPSPAALVTGHPSVSTPAAAAPVGIVLCTNKGISVSKVSLRWNRGSFFLFAGTMPWGEGQASQKITPAARADSGDISSCSHKNTLLEEEKIYFSGCSIGEAVIYFLIAVQFYKKTHFFFFSSSLWWPYHISNACLTACQLYLITSFKAYWSECSPSMQETPGHSPQLSSFARHVGLQETMFVALNTLFHHDACVQ